MANRKQTAPPKARAKPIDQDLFLAATHRAGVAQDGRRQGSYSYSAKDRREFRHMSYATIIAEHLGLPLEAESYFSSISRVSGAARTAYRNGLIERHMRLGYRQYRLSQKGQRRLRYLGQQERYPQLPPSPEWVEWDRAIKTAKSAIPVLRKKLRELLKGARTVVNSDDPRDFRVPGTKYPYQNYGCEIDTTMDSLERHLKAQVTEEPPKY